MLEAFKRVMKCNTSDMYSPMIDNLRSEPASCMILHLHVTYILHVRYYYYRFVEQGRVGSVSSVITDTLNRPGEGVACAVVLGGASCSDQLTIADYGYSKCYPQYVCLMLNLLTLTLTLTTHNDTHTVII